MYRCRLLHLRLDSLSFPLVGLLSVGSVLVPQLISICKSQLLGYLLLFPLALFLLDLLDSFLPLFHDIGIAPATASAGPFAAIFRHPLSCISTAFDPTELTLSVGVHEAPNCHQRRPDTPRWLPCFLVVSRYAQADLAVDFEAAGGREEAEVWWSERVLRRQYYAPMVDATGVCGRGFGAFNCEVPLEDVIF